MTKKQKIEKILDEIEHLKRCRRNRVYELNEVKDKHEFYAIEAEISEIEVQISELEDKLLEYQK